MEDALIGAVCGQSVLYDTTLVSYRDRIKKEQAWVVVGQETGIPGMKRKRASGVPCGNTPIQEAILQALQRDGQLCEDAQFLNGLLPSLKRLPPDTKEYVKFQLHKVIFDATQFTLNLEPV
ncbi:unnamed protein product [Arctogadus glacialis]